MRLSEKIIILSAALAAAPLSIAYAQMAPQTTTTTGALPGNDIGTRSSLPRSPYVSNITSGDTKSTIAPTPPEPSVGPDASVQQLLMASNQAIGAGQTGTADEALEQAETQILTRTVPQTQTDYASADPVVAQIEQARAALGSNDNAQASQVITQVLASNAPELMQ
jgi:hypothetical protein